MDNFFIRAERRCGEMLKATAETGERDKGGNRKPQSHDAIVEKRKTLAELGVEPDQSSRYQKLAAIPEETFEAALTESAKKKGVPTTAGVMRAVEVIHRLISVTIPTYPQANPCDRKSYPQAKWLITCG